MSNNSLRRGAPGWPQDPPGYRLLEKLGQGGMGEVYRALDLRNRVVVAIKFALQGQSQRFVREFNHLNKLKHPNILKVFQMESAVTQPYIVMEYLDGQTWDQFCRSFPDRRLPLSVGLPLYIQLTDALEYIHQAGLIHRDLKPANLMVINTTAQLVVKIMDFGLVKPLAPTQALTRFGIPLGSPPYMAPEQFVDPGHVTIKADLYSLGVVLYETIAGRRPFEAHEINQWMDCHLKGAVIPLKQLVTNLPPGLSGLILALMAKQPGSRPESALDVKQALEQIADPQSLESIRDWTTSGRLPTGKVLNNRYRIDGMISQGGFGAIYLAWDLNLKRKCALKENLSSSPESQKQFELEARILAELHHPNLPRVTDHFILLRHGQYLVMDFIEGSDLETMRQLAKQKPGGFLSVEDVLGWGDQICTALQYLHSQQPPIIHRDIKPQNIIITNQNRAVLVDFGIAKVDPEKHTQSGAMGGTPGYAPPEQYGVSGTRTDARSDIYSLGATLYALLTNHNPPESVAVLNQIEPLPVSAYKINQHVSRQVSDALKKAMSLQREDRFANITEFKKALGDYQTKAIPGSSPSMAKPFFQISILEIIVSLVFLAFCGIVGAFSFSKAIPLVAALVDKTDAPIPTDTHTPTFTITPSPTFTGTSTKTATPILVTPPSDTPTPTLTPSETLTPTTTPSETLTPTTTPSETATPTITQMRPLTGFDGMMLLPVPAGEFIRGASDKNIDDIRLICGQCSRESMEDASPQQLVYLDAFYIDETEVNNAQFRHFVNETNYETSAEVKGISYVLFKWDDPVVNVYGADWQHPTGPDSDILFMDYYPVTHISWEDADAYCEWAKRRLPTEAEWEKAARGTDARLFPWGNQAPDQNLVNFNFKPNHITPAKDYPQGRSPYGAFNMAGNIWEWVNDFYDASYYQFSPLRNPFGPSNGSFHVLRGGSWRSYAYNYLSSVTTFFRLSETEDVPHSNYYGFRCASNP